MAQREVTKVERAESQGHAKHRSDHGVPVFKSVRTFTFRLMGAYQEGLEQTVACCMRNKQEDKVISRELIWEGNGIQERNNSSLDQMIHKEGRGNR